MEVVAATEPAPGGVNEDYVVVGPDWIVVLDGATVRPDVRTGCVHGPAWLVRRLAGTLASRLAGEAADPPADLLHEAIEAAGAGHSGSCDLANPDSPSATVAVLRRRGTALDWLVLGDCAVVLDLGAELRTVVDDRTAHLRSYTAEAVRAARNSPGGFWVASTRPEAAYEALTGSAPLARVRRAAVLTDGATRLVDRFGLMSWQGLLDLLEARGPAELIHRTRAAERAEDPRDRARRRGKHHDDATAVFVRPGGGGRS